MTFAPDRSRKILLAAQLAKASDRSQLTDSWGWVTLTLQCDLRYDTLMGSEIRSTTDSAILDLTGLPEPVVKSIKQLVESLREGIATQSHMAATCEPASLRGRFANLGLSIPKEDLDEAQREAWQDFPRKLPDPDQS